ncbi:MAG: serine/threonine protein kinase [Gemmataceae bacterium]|nr:serine/threonine protein kinase [Gemmataceae bacterium]
MPEPPPDDRLAGLLSAWFAAYSDGRDPAPEDLTSDPHLLPLLRDGIAAAKRLDPARTTQVPPEAGTPTVPIPAARPLPPRLGRFEVREQCGEGAFGAVYRAFDPLLRREVAVKVPRPERLSTAADRDRFLKEARAAATIRHPNVCPVYEVGEVDGFPYLVMAFVAGRSLQQELTARGKPFDPAEAARVVRSLALAAQAAHGKGVLHRDLKPANVLFDPETREFLITDFGMARLTDPADPRASGAAIVGSPAYMSPEQARGDSAGIGPWSDVYSLGVVLFELLTGRIPYRGSSVADVLTTVLTAPVPTVARPDLPAGLADVCKKAMAKAPKERYQTAREFAAALEPFAAGRPPARPWLRTAGLVALLVLAVAVAVFNYLARTRPPG